MRHAVIVVIALLQATIIFLSSRQGLSCMQVGRTWSAPVQSAGRSWQA